MLCHIFSHSVHFLTYVSNDDASFILVGRQFQTTTPIPLTNFTFVQKLFINRIKHLTFVQKLFINRIKHLTFVQKLFINRIKHSFPIYYRLPSPSVTINVLQPELRSGKECFIVIVLYIPFQHTRLKWQ